MRAVVLGVGVSAMALACSFGEIDNGETKIDPPTTTDGSATNAGDGAQSDVVDSAPTGNSRGANNNPTTAKPDTTAAGDDPFEATDLGKEVKQILEVNCGACHQGTKSGDMDYILNLNELVKNDKVIPGKKEDSQIFVRMQQGSMPPAFQRTQRPTFGQIDQVGQFIDELDPSFGGNNASCDTVPFISSDDQIALMANDISRLDSRDQPFTRYLTITYSSNAGGCEGPRKDLERQRFALFKGINSVSTETTVGVPQPIDAAQTIYRIDIRDYNWDRGIDIEDDGVQDFADGWDAIVAGVQGRLVQGNLAVNPNSAVLLNNDAYAVEYTGDQADDLKADSGTAIPFMPVNAFIQATEFADLYYSLIGAKANIFDFEKDVLLIDTNQEKADDNLLRAGFSNSGVSKQERVLNRFDQGTAGGYSYWLSFDFDGGSGNGKENLANDSIYQNPIDFLFTGGEAIFNLPNGFQGYYVANAAGARLSEAPVGIVIDPAQNNGTVTNGASCHSCHNAGMITFTDTVRPFVEANKQLFDNETYEHVINQYPKDPADFQRVMDADSAVHVNAVEKSGIPKGTPDAVSRVYLDFQFNVNITLKLAAGELGVTEDFLKNSIQDLSPELVNLADKDGYVSREVFSANFLDSLCTLHTTDENQPANCP